MPVPADLLPAPVLASPDALLPSRMSDSAPFRIASGQGFWGDLARAPIDQARGGPIDVLVMDYLAEVTMSIMQKQRARNPKAGYATDFVKMVERVLPRCIEQNIKILANAGGVNAPGGNGSVDWSDETPSDDDETIEDSGLAGRPVVERILGARLIEERSLDGGPLG